jgi:hypothetical protein
LHHFALEDQCTETQKRASLPKGLSYPCWGDARRYLVIHDARKLFQCIGCRHQASVTAGTMMEHVTLPLIT